LSDETGGRRLGKQCRQIADWIAKVKSGKASLIVGRDYIVMSRDMYLRLVRRTNK